MAAHTFDVFVSYRWVDPDQDWVRDSLVPALKIAGLKVCLDVEDFVPGRDLILEMSRAGTQSRHALCILSPDYFNGNRMVGFEGLMARRGDPLGNESKLIPLIYRSVAIPEWLRGLIPLDWTEPKHRSREWRKLLKVLAAPLPDAPEPDSPHEFDEQQARVPEPSPVVERCRALIQQFQPNAIGFDQLIWIREADSVTIDVWHHAGLPDSEELGAVLKLWKMAIDRRAELPAGRLVASVGHWRMAECLFTTAHQRTTQILLGLGLGEDESLEGLGTILERINQLATYLREYLLSFDERAYFSSQINRVYDEAVSSLEGLFGQDHPSVGLMLANCAICATHSDLLDRAHSLLERAVDIGHKAANELHESVLLAVAQIRGSFQMFSLQGGSLCPKRSRNLAKRLALSLSRSVTEMSHGAADPQRSLHLTLLNELGELKLDMGETEEAEKCFEQARRLAAEVPDNNQETVRPVIGLVEIFMRRDEVDRAYELFKRVPPDMPFEPRIMTRLNIAVVGLRMQFSAHKKQVFEEKTTERINLLRKKLKGEP